jgi:hypothetical protein
VTAACGGQQQEAPWLTNPGIDGHASYFPLRGTPHDPSGLAAATSCEGCHKGTSFRQFVCTDCHTAAATDPIHAGSLVVSGYVPGAVTSADCYRCHPQGTSQAPANHAALFPIGTPEHPASCRMCHTDPFARTDPTKLACQACHDGRPGFATAHANVPDFTNVAVMTAPWCLRCHADGRVLRVALHEARDGGSPKGPSGPGLGSHSTHCFTCHTMIPPYALWSGPGPGVAGLPWAQDWSVVGCVQCHP